MTCTTHHHACECREAKFKLLLNAAKFLTQSHAKCMELSYPAGEVEPEEFYHYRSIATRESEEIKRLWSELKWD